MTFNKEQKEAILKLERLGIPTVEAEALVYMVSPKESLDSSDMSILIKKMTQELNS